ncbi:hypothetical protein PoB_006323200 [Plakobranchus ocellatus]|uniref:Uncharacterized protein n=1 Tax=Plakobranchus ocellatus TaxID=259542 RepID=A0AAV4CXT0_9GAST|nr:hypothetical protein PoB_006323200 [Plakobranchus ocellatus]
MCNMRAVAIKMLTDLGTPATTVSAQQTLLTGTGNLPNACPASMKPKKIPANFRSAVCNATADTNKITSTTNKRTNTITTAIDTTKIVNSTVVVNTITSTIITIAITKNNFTKITNSTSKTPPSTSTTNTICD